MKKCTILIAVFLIAISSSIGIQAEVINEENARVIATEFLSQQRDGHRLNASLADLTLAQTRFSSS